jgi:hypothetical protein
MKTISKLFTSLLFIMSFSIITPMYVDGNVPNLTTNPFDDWDKQLRTEVTLENREKIKHYLQTEFRKRCNKKHEQKTSNTLDSEFCAHIYEIKDLPVSSNIIHPSDLMFHDNLFNYSHIEKLYSHNKKRPRQNITKIVSIENIPSSN